MTGIDIVFRAPVMLSIVSIVSIVRRTRPWYEGGAVA